MTKKIYDKELHRYWYTYYCDCCFKVLGNGEILREENALEFNIFDLCERCKSKWKTYSLCGKEDHND